MEPHFPCVGDPAPAFALTDAEGVTQRLEDYRGRNVVLVFTRHLM